MNAGVTTAQFVAKWSRVTLPERAASQEHFLDLCRLLGQPTPAEHDATGTEYTFEKGVPVLGPAPSRRSGAGVSAGQTRGYADVWWRGKFAWEYKRKDKYADLADAYRQLCQYREALENPPLLIVSDIARIQIHTNFTGTRKDIHEIPLDALGHPDHLAKLRRVFEDPNSFKPTLTTNLLTESAAAEFAKIADQLRQRRHDPHAAAHFLMKCMFCLFAEDVKLLPGQVFTRLLERYKGHPEKLTDRLRELFRAMRTGGDFGADAVPHFNGGLFDDAPPLALGSYDINTLLIAAQFDWGAVEPSIFGTLFERSLDPSKRSQIGAHYTSREDIMLIVEPVVMAPLRQEWAEIKEQIEAQLGRRRKAATPGTKKRADVSIAERIEGFLHRLSSLGILDPACGSGNFLYVAIQELLTLEKEVIVYGSRPEIGLGLFPRVRPTQLHGIEINPYAAELAQVVIWIGYLQWMKENGFVVPRDPILSPLTTIECRDAILDITPLPSREGPGEGVAADAPVGRRSRAPRPATWPEADFIIGNPPFLGSKLFRQYGLDDDYIAAMYAAYDLPKTSDLCCYWFEQARRVACQTAPVRERQDRTAPVSKRPIRAATARERSGTSAAQPLPDGRGSERAARAPARRPVRVGLLATQGIRGGDNRTVLERIKHTGDIFMAWSDREWILDGAAVHVSMVGFDDGTDKNRTLDGTAAPEINPDLTADVNTTRAQILSENRGFGFMGDTKVGPFEIELELARAFIGSANPKATGNFTVVRPWANGLDITRRPRSVWIVDFPPRTTLEHASQFHEPFEYIAKHVRPMRKTARSGDATGVPWWIHQRPRPDMRERVETLRRFLATPNVTKHRLFVFVDGRVLPDHQLIVFARADDYFFGVLHSAVHELWARRMGTQLREAESGFRYTPTTCFETFPLPWPPGTEPRSEGSGHMPAGRRTPLPDGRGSERAGAARRATLSQPLPEREGSKTPGQPLPEREGGELHGRISEAARELNEQRERWLNPPEWIADLGRLVDSKDKFADVPADARPLLRWSAIMAEAARDPRFKKRTLTHLYNERPTWLKLAHEKLDRAVLAAYAAVDPEGEWAEDWAAVWVETGAGQPLETGHPLAARRKEIDQRVLANLLRVNLVRAATQL